MLRLISMAVKMRAPNPISLRLLSLLLLEEEEDGSWSKTRSHKYCRRSGVNCFESAKTENCDDLDCLLSSLLEVNQYATP